MKTLKMKNKNIFLRRTTQLLLCLSLAIVFNSCEDMFAFELPEANSKVDTVLPRADFSYIPDADDFTKIQFQNLSFESTKYLWDFGGGNTSTEVDPTYTFAGGEGTYSVTLTASDGNGASNTTTLNVVVEDLFVAITPEIINGDMEDSSNGWRLDFSNGWDRFGFESSSDGSWLKYDGTDNGSKTRGAKWNMSRSAAEWASSNTRHAYQSIVVSPNTNYILEYEYAIKDDDAPDPIGGRRIVAEILDGHFTDGALAFAQSDAGGALATNIGVDALGKTTFTTVKLPFTANATGEVAIWIWAVTPVDAYVDNVKVYPAD
jgi:PKD repeat protein